jgi:hypothetical protein
MHIVWERPGGIGDLRFRPVLPTGARRPTAFHGHSVIPKNGARLGMAPVVPVTCP